MPKAPPPSRLSRRQLPAPFLKWAGGKRQLLPLLLRAAPDAIQTYYEPFIGGGALFFALQAANRFRHAVLADQNEELILCYQAVRDGVEKVIRELKRLSHDEDEYYQLRAASPAAMSGPERAARTIYLNKVGFNGLYRVNSRGLFNVPFGRYARPNICDEPRLRAAAVALKDVELQRRDFAETVASAQPNDFVYLDPPYVPLSATSSFTSYAETPFGPDEQARLAETLRELGKRGVPALLSNSDCRLTRQLYKGLRPQKVEVRRAINSVATRRGSVGEILVKSFRF